MERATTFLYENRIVVTNYVARCARMLTAWDFMHYVLKFGNVKLLKEGYMIVKRFIYFGEKGEMIYT